MIKKILFLCIFIFFSNNLSAANTLAVIDLQKVLSNSSAAKYILDSLNAKMAEYQNEIDKSSKDLQAKHNSLSKQSSVLSEDVLKEKQEEIFKQLKLLESDVAQKKKKLQTAYTKTLSVVEKKMIKIVSDLGEKKAYNVIFTKENLIFHQNIDDISEEVITMLNNQLPKVELSL